MRLGWFGLPVFGKKPEPQLVSCTISGGGARASFQIGALAYLYRHDPEFTPTIFVGASAGAILCAGLAQSTDQAEQSAWVDSMEALWLRMRSSEDMFTPRQWYRKLQAEGPTWLQMFQPSEPQEKPPSRVRLPFLRRETPEGPRSPESPLDPVEYALTPEQEPPSGWSLQHLSAIAGNVGRLPRIGSDVSAIWQGLEQTQSMYRPGPVLQQLLEPGFFQSSRVADSGATLRVAMVALESGELRFMTENGTLVGRSNEPFDDASYDLVLGLLASCSIPAVFRAVPVGEETYVDGGTRENLPAELAIGWTGAARNYVISSQVGGTKRRPSMADDNLFSVIMRSAEILVDEAGRDELEYAISAGAKVIYPEADVHDAMTVHPGLLKINRDYGWMRAAEVNTEADADVIRKQRLLTKHRVRCVQLEQQHLADPDDQSVRDEIRQAKHQLKRMVDDLDPLTLPPDASQWWRDFEPGSEPFEHSVWWLDD